MASKPRQNGGPLKQLICFLISHTSQEQDGLVIHRGFQPFHVEAASGSYAGRGCEALSVALRGL